MKPNFSKRFIDSYNDAPLVIQKLFKKQLRLLLRDIRYPSLHAKKYQEKTGMWQARVNDVWRFYFTIQGDVYYMHDIMTHPK